MLHSHTAITAVDAIMDEGVFEHLKKFSSYKYSLYQQRKQQQQQQLQQQQQQLQQQQQQLQQRLQQVQATLRQLHQATAQQQQQQQQSVAAAAAAPVDVGEQQQQQLLQEKQQELQQLQEQQQQLQQRLSQLQRQQQMEVLDEFAAIRRINNEACTLLASNYEGYAWMAQVAARVTELLLLPEGEQQQGGPPGGTGGPPGGPQGAAAAAAQQRQRELLQEHEQLLLDSSSSSSSSTKNFEQASADSILVAALCELLATKYNSHVSRKLLQDRSQHGSWRPPPFYWHLFNHPCIVRQMLQLYRQRPQDEFLACWFEDFALHRRQPGPAPLPSSDSEAVLTAKVSRV
ncbi:hypothetical protein, conserved [Eimeria necatrix]|uniref:Uncharacterized protein n=1 Tax=Eimeria necatrix TaxID=51315 RepID=U6MQF4_9EIME|nr:hypothetical protein, conserved [Eimeria necatrix]CDJ64694.1 hypothetical protein, conserved [Eimeria necatrix]